MFSQIVLGLKLKIQSSLLTCDTSDHLPVLFNLEVISATDNMSIKTIPKRRFSKDSIRKFNITLQNTDW